MEHDGNIAAAETIEAPPPSSTDIMTAIGQMRAEISDMRGEISNIRTAIHDDVIVRVEGMERIIETLPTVYASADSLNKVKSSQEEYEQSRRALTKQFADMANVQADNQQKFSMIQAQLNELSSMKGMLTTFVETQRERLDNQQASIIEVKATTATLAKDVRRVDNMQVDSDQRYNTHFKPLHDFIVGSETQKPMMTVIDNIQTAQMVQGQTLQVVADYVKAQQQKEADRLSFWRAVRLQMWTWRGVLSMLLALVVVLIIANSINFDQLFERIRQLADVIAAVLRSVKVG